MVDYQGQHSSWGARIIEGKARGKDGRAETTLVGVQEGRLLAEDDAILQAQLEVGANAHACHLFYPVAQIFLRLLVILGCDLKYKSPNFRGARRQGAALRASHGPQLLVITH